MPFYVMLDDRFCQDTSIQEATSLDEAMKEWEPCVQDWARQRDPEIWDLEEAINDIRENVADALEAAKIVAHCRYGFWLVYTPLTGLDNPVEFAQWSDREEIESFLLGEDWDLNEVLWCGCD